MKIEPQISKIIRKLQYAAIIAIFVASILLLLWIDAWRFWQEPTKDMTVTFQMYESKVAQLKILLLQLIPAIAVCFMSFGFLVLHYMRKLSLLEEAKKQADEETES